MNKFLCITLITLFLSGCWTTEKGEKIGILVKSSKEGLFIKTNEAELIRGGMTDGSGGFGTQKFDFTIEDEEMLEIANEALENSKKVKIKYHREFATLWRCESNNYFLDSIEILN